MGESVFGNMAVPFTVISDCVCYCNFYYVSVCLPGVSLRRGAVVPPGTETKRDVGAWAPGATLCTVGMDKADGWRRDG